ncbi:MAG: copper chaperone PCu(A)C [Candidatus Eisenbacteria bacterium]|uniref:Copper chaperone PCu(A)C n=1 Tax=Eiseniibacteriota bacterium TaxID=2212470 RepID=A0A933SB45_UNCEI|nr:copper chaperone PCu(A)C [Candidatus Eisenbacteria bacterium]
MNRNVLPVLVLLFALVSLGSCTKRERHPMASEGLRGEAAVNLKGFHARPTPDGATVGAIFGTITAPLGDTLRAVKVAPDVAEKVEIHRIVQNAAGQMEMRPVPWLALPEDEPVELKPGGLHVMLFGLAAPLQAGKTVRLTLLFQDGGERVLEVPIRDE